jgi:uncharacterized membrane protein
MSQSPISAARSFSLTEAATRREVLLFGLLIAAMLFALDGLRPRVIEVPAGATRVESPLGWTSSSPVPIH